LSDYLQRYLPEYDDDKEREKLSAFSKDDLIYMLIVAYKEKRVIAKWLGEEQARLQRIKDVLDEPSKLLNMPGIPGSDDIKKMLE
jgi:hypothetical protein